MTGNRCYGCAQENCIYVHCTCSCHEADKAAAEPIISQELILPVESSEFSDLTPREREVAKRLAVGRSCREIAAELDVSHKTIDTHRSRIMHKLRIRNAVELAHKAIRHGLVTLQ